MTFQMPGDAMISVITFQMPSDLPQYSFIISVVDCSRRRHYFRHTTSTDPANKATSVPRCTFDLAKLHPQLTCAASRTSILDHPPHVPPSYKLLHKLFTSQTISALSSYPMVRIVGDSAVVLPTLGVAQRLGRRGS